jgi:nicotinamidase-related amidase
MSAAGALVVLDMQKDLCEASARTDQVRRVLGPLRQAIDLFADAGRPVCYVCLELPRDDPQFARFGDVYCVEGTPGAEIIDELRPLRGPVVKKRKHSAFFETDLDERLRDDGVTDLYLVGLQTQICVMTTAADASFRGYRTVAIRDCVISTRDAAKEEALRWIERYVGEVLPLSGVVGELSRR